jgi:voltage-gated potassium channel
MDEESESVEMKNLPMEIMVFSIILGSLFLIGSFGFMWIEKISFSLGFVRTIESLAFIFKETSGLGRSLEVLLAVFGVFLVWWILWTIADLVFEGKISEYLKVSRYKSILMNLHHHYIIAGGGRVGEEIARDLVRLNKKTAIIEKDPLKVSKLRKKGYIVIEGDANDVESRILDKARIKEAAVLIIAMPETEKNLLLTLMAKEIKPDIDIYVRCDHPEFVSRLKKAGAKSVIVPELVAADKFIKDIFS